MLKKNHTTEVNSHFKDKILSFYQLQDTTITFTWNSRSIKRFCDFLMNRGLPVSLSVPYEYFGIIFIGLTIGFFMFDSEIYKKQLGSSQLVALSPLLIEDSASESSDEEYVTVFDLCTAQELEDTAAPNKLKRKKKQVPSGFGAIDVSGMENTIL